MLGPNSDLALESRRKAANTRMHAVVTVAIVALWLCPIGLFWRHVWYDGRPFSMLRCALCMATGLLTIFLPASYYQPKSFEVSGRFYKRLGVRWVKRWVPDGDYVVWRIRHFVPAYKVISSRGGLSAFDARTRRSEAGHLIWMFVTVPAVVYAFFCGWAKLAWWLFVGNLIINVYPIMIQRYNRARIRRILARAKPG